MKTPTRLLPGLLILAVSFFMMPNPSTAAEQFDPMSGAMDFAEAHHGMLAEHLFEGDFDIDVKAVIEAEFEKRADSDADDEDLPKEMNFEKEAAVDHGADEAAKNIDMAKEDENRDMPAEDPGKLGETHSMMAKADDMGALAGDMMEEPTAMAGSATDVATDQDAVLKEVKAANQPGAEPSDLPAESAGAITPDADAAMADIAPDIGATTAEGAAVGEPDAAAGAGQEPAAVNRRAARNARNAAGTAGGFFGNEARRLINRASAGNLFQGQTAATPGAGERRDGANAQDLSGFDTNNVVTGNTILGSTTGQGRRSGQGNQTASPDLSGFDTNNSVTGNTIFGSTTGQGRRNRALFGLAGRSAFQPRGRSAETATGEVRLTNVLPKATPASDELDQVPGEPEAAADAEVNIFEFKLVGLPADFVGRQFDGLSGAGAEWTIEDGTATLKEDGTLQVDVQGLVLMDGTTGSVENVSAVVTCGGTEAARTSPFALDMSGSATHEETLSLPSPCAAPMVFIAIEDLQAQEAGTRFIALGGR